LHRTALCAHEIVAFLKAETVQLHLRSIGAPPLMPKPLGGISTERYHAHEGN